MKPREDIIEVNQQYELEGLDEEEQMKRLLGFDSLDRPRATPSKTIKSEMGGCGKDAGRTEMVVGRRRCFGRQNAMNGSWETEPG